MQRIKRDGNGISIYTVCGTDTKRVARYDIQLTSKTRRGGQSALRFSRLREEQKVNLLIELISGNLTQKRRENVLAKFRSKKINCLIATDVAARGLDIEKVSHVFNYDLPQFEENYIHRIGRTARVSGKEGNFENGTAITLVMKDQIRIMSRIEGIVNRRIQKRTLPPRYNQNQRRYGSF